VFVTSSPVQCTLSLHTSFLWFQGFKPHNVFLFQTQFPLVKSAFLLVKTELVHVGATSPSILLKITISPRALARICRPRERNIEYYAQRMADVFSSATEPRLLAEMMTEIPALDILEIKYAAGGKWMGFGGEKWSKEKFA